MVEDRRVASIIQAIRHHAETVVVKNSWPIAGHSMENIPELILRQVWESFGKDPILIVTQTAIPEIKYGMYVTVGQARRFIKYAFLNCACGAIQRGMSLNYSFKCWIMIKLWSIRIKPVSGVNPLNRLNRYMSQTFYHINICISYKHVTCNTFLWYVTKLFL